MQMQSQPLLHDHMDYHPSENAGIGAMVATATKTLIGLEVRLNALDAKVGDGDTGSTLAAGARDIARLLDDGKLPLNNTAQLLQFIGERLATVMGGSSGVLMSIFFTAAGQRVAEGKGVAQALQGGLKQMKRYGGADRGDRTLIDALEPALTALVQGSLSDAAIAAQRGAQSTAEMTTAVAGQASEP